MNTFGHASIGLSLIPFIHVVRLVKFSSIYLRFLLFQSIFNCSNLGSLLENDRKSTSETVDNRPVHTILGPQYFIAEVENEAILAKEFQQAKIQSTHNSRSSIHGSHSQLMPCEIDDHFITKSTVSIIFDLLFRFKVRSCYFHFFDILVACRSC